MKYTQEQPKLTRKYPQHQGPRKRKKPKTNYKMTQLRTRLPTPAKAQQAYNMCALP
jgi:hypothetical protein